MKCTMAKNPCRICFETVTNKTGLQCKGDCKKWAHFKCLKYTPGRIKDIQNGYIIVRCHCAECKADEPKEFMLKQPYNCCKSGCQSNLPACDNVKFPINLPLPCTSTQTCFPTHSYTHLTDRSSDSIYLNHLPSPSKPLPRKPGLSPTSPKDPNSPSDKAAGLRFSDLTIEQSPSNEPSPGKLRLPKFPLFKHTDEQEKPLLNKTTSPETNNQKTKLKCYSHTSLMSNDMNNVGDGLDLKHISDTNICNANEQHAIVSAVDKMHAAVNQLATQMDELITQIKYQTNKQHK